MKLGFRNTWQTLLWTLPLWLLLLPFSRGWAQPAAGAQFFTMQQGLSSQQALDIISDEHGYIWVATELGLNRFASGEFKTYYQSAKQDGSSINSNEINTLFYQNGKLYIGTRSNGLNVLDEKRDTFTYFTHDPQNPHSIATNDITDIIAGAEGHLWLATYHQGLQLMDTRTGHFTRFNRDNTADMPENGIWSLAKDNSGNLYLGHVNQGVSIFNIKTKSIKRLTVANTAGALPEGEVKRIFCDSKGYIWIGTRRGLARYSPQTGVLEAIPLAAAGKRNSEPFIYAIKEIGDTIWVGAESSQLFVLKQPWSDTTATQMIDLKRGNNSSVQQIACDDFGNIWFSLYNAGIGVFTKQRPFFQTYPSPSNYTDYTGLIAPVVSIIAPSSVNSEALLITEGTGILKLEGDNTRPTPITGQLAGASSFLLCAMQDSRGALWFGPRDGGLFRAEKAGTSPTEVNLGEPVHEVRAISESSDGKLWIACRQGVFRYDPSTGSYEKVEMNSPMFGDYAPRALGEDSKGNLWVGTYGQGLYVYDANLKLRARMSVEDSTLASNTINHIYKDRNDNMWIATNESIALASTHDPLGKLSLITPVGSSDAWHIIHAITEDNNGHIWCSTKSGLLRYLPEEQRFLQYDNSFGVPLGGFVNSSVARDARGLLYFGMQDRLCIFDPATIPLALQESPVRVSRFSVFTPNQPDTWLDIPMEGATAIVLASQQNSFRVQLAVMDFGLTDLVEFSYMLRGHDSDWISVGPTRTLDFRNVPYGNYELRIRARMKNGDWTKEFQQISVNIAPPYYLSALAWILYIGLGSAIVISLIFLYLKRMKAEAELHLLERKHQQDEKLYSERLNFFTNITHELRTPLTLILGPLEELLQDTKLPSRHKTLVGTLNKSAQRLFSLVNQLLEFRKVESQYKPLVLEEGFLGELVEQTTLKYRELSSKPALSISCELPEVDQKTLFDPEIMQLLLDNLLSNAYKFTDQGFIKVRLYYQEQGLSRHSIIEISDSGCGIAAEHTAQIFEKFYQVPSSDGRGTGVGLALAKELASIHGGRIEVTSRLGQGSTFTLSIRSALVSPAPAGLHKEVHEDEQLTKSTQRALILLVEDDPDLRAYTAELLAQKYQVLQAEQGGRGIKLAKKHIPDLVLSDIMMPDIDGFALLKALKEQRETSHIPVVFLSAKDTPIDRQRGYALGVDSYLSKPTSGPVLFERIDNLLRKQRQAYQRALAVISEKANTTTADTNPARLDEPYSNFPENDFIRDFVSVVREHLEDEVLDAAMLAQKLNMSQSTLYRKLKALTGKNINQLVRKVRLHRAAELLHTGEYNITQASLMVGIGSAIYFRQCFKEEFGMLPSEYQKQSSRAGETPES